MSKTRDKRLHGLASSLCEELLRHESPIQPEDLLQWFNCNIKETDLEHREEIDELDELFPAPHNNPSKVSRLRQVVGLEGITLIETIVAAAEEIELLRDLLRRAKVSVEGDVQMAADISRFAPLDPEGQMLHDTTETPAEKLLPEIERALKRGQRKEENADDKEEGIRDI